MLTMKNVCTNCQVISGAFDGKTVCMSYGTPVLAMDTFGHVSRLWSGWSVTTQKHINKGFPGLKLTKKMWDAMPVERVEA